MKLPTKVLHWDDEREMGNGLIISLKNGFAFRDNDSSNAQHVAGFDSVRDARREIAAAQRCSCAICKA